MSGWGFRRLTPLGERGSAHQRGVLALVALTAVFGFFGVLIRILDAAGFTPLQQVYLRCAIGVLAGLLIFGPVPLGKLRLLSPAEWALLVARGIGGFLAASVLFSAAVVHTSLANAALISSLPVVALFGFALAPRSARLWQVLGTLGAFAGAVLIAAEDLSNPFDWGIGDAYALLSVVAISLVFLSRKWHSGILSNSELSLLTLFFGGCSVFVAALLSAEGAVPTADWSPLTVTALVTAGTLLMVNSLLANYGFQHVGNVLAGNLLVLEAAFGLLFGLLLYGEWPTPRGLAGGAVVVACVLLVNNQDMGRRTTAAGAARSDDGIPAGPDAVPADGRTPVGQPPAVTGPVVAPSSAWSRLMPRVPTRRRAARSRPR